MVSNWFQKSIIFLILLSIGCTPTAEVGPTTLPARPTVTSEAPPPIPSPTSTADTPTAPPVVPTETAAIPTITAKPPLEQQLQHLAMDPEGLDYSIVVQIGGVPQAIELLDDIAFLGVGTRLTAVDISDPTQPTFLNQTGLLNGLVKDIAFAGDYAYLATGQGGVAVVDIRLPGQAEIVNIGPGYSGANQPASEMIFVQDEVVFVLDSQLNGQSELIRLDISSPESPQFLDATSLPDFAKIKVANGLIFVQRDIGIDILDSADPSQKVGQFPIDSQAYNLRLGVEGNTAVVTSSSDNGLRLFDIADPQNPLEIEQRTTDVELFSTHLLAVSGDTLITAGTYGEFGFCVTMLTFFDFQREANIKIGELDPQNCATDMVVHDNKLFLVGRSGLFIFDIGNLAAPQKLGQFRSQSDILDVQAAVQNDQFVYVMSAEGRGANLQTIDLSQPAHFGIGDPIFLGSHPMLNLFYKNETLFASAWNSDWLTFDVSQPEQPSPLYMFNQDQSGVVSDLFGTVLFDTFYIAPTFSDDLQGGLIVVDITDPVEPKQLTVFQTGMPQIWSAVRSDDYLITLSGETPSLHIFDLGVPQNPIMLSELALPRHYARIGVLGDQLILSCESWNCDQVGRVDMSDPTQPFLQEEWMAPFGFNEMMPLDGQRLVVTTWENGIWVLDFSEDEAPRLNGRIPIPQATHNIKTSGNMLTVPANDAGFYLIRIEDERE